jgi:folylpolyglutamate synthase
MEVRERIRINGAPISKDKFSDYFYYCYDRLVGKHRSEYRPHLPGPSYFRFLTLVAFHAFMEENVNAVILEVGIGGEYDSTNVIVNPVSCGVTKIGLDHQNVLGYTVAEIAWHKAGIIKQNRPSVTCENQLPSALEVIQKRADEKNSHLTVASPLPKDVQLSLAGSHQRENASVAIELCDIWFHQQIPKGPACWTDSTKSKLTQFTLDGLMNTKWPGRSQIVNESKRTWYLDGAHTADSVNACVDWFVNQLSSDVKKICLLYNAANGRNGLEMIEIISKKLKNLENIQVQLVTCPNIIYKEDGLGRVDAVNNTVNKDPKLELQHQVEAWWIENHPENSLPPKVFSTIEESAQYIQSISEAEDFNHILVTGSLHLIGGAMTVLDLPVQ